MKLSIDVLVRGEWGVSGGEFGVDSIQTRNTSASLRVLRYRVDVSASLQVLR
jgi:hypothetical protein